MWDLDEQPHSEVKANTISVAAAAPAKPVRRSPGTGANRELFSNFVLRQVGPAPPAAAQRVKQRGRIGITISLRLDKVDLGLPIALFGAQQPEVADVAVLRLSLHQVERCLGGGVGGRGCLEGLGVLLER